MRKLTVFGLAVLLTVCASTSAFAAKKTPVPFSSRARMGNTYFDAATPLNWGKEGSAADTVWIRVKDDSTCSYTGSALFGSRGESAPGWATWCFDGGLGDSLSTTTRYGGGLPGAFIHYDAHIFGQTNKWHISTYDTYLPGLEDSSMWCGELGNPLSWETPPGYGPGYRFNLVLDLGNSATFNTANGMTIGGVHLYANELAYDYCFLEMAASGTPDTATWRQITRFNGISNPDSVNCRGLGGSYWGSGSGIGNGPYPYLCADWVVFNQVVTAAELALLGQNGAEKLLVRWRVTSDFLWDDLTGGGTQADTRGAWRIDHVLVKGNNSPNSYFPGNASARTDNVDWETSGEVGRSQFSTALIPGAEESGGQWVDNPGSDNDYWLHGRSKIVDLWTLTNAPNYPNLGQTCNTSNRWIWGSNFDTVTQTMNNVQQSAFLYRLSSPVIDTSPNSVYTNGTSLDNTRVSGAIIQYDTYICFKSVSEDVVSWVGRVYLGSPQNTWNQWEYAAINIGGCQFWNTPDFDTYSSILNAETDSIQFGVDKFDQCDYNSGTEQACMPGVLVVNPHRKNAIYIDNISIGLFSQKATLWGVGNFQDTFARDVHLHPPSKDNSELYAADVRQDEDSLGVSVVDFDGIAQNSVVIHYRVSTDCGTSWSHETSRVQGSKAKPAIEWFTKSLNFSQPDADAEVGEISEFNGEYRTVLEVNTTDFPGSLLSGGILREGTVVEYYFTAADRSIPAVADTVPNRAAARRTFIHPKYGTERQQPWPYEVTVLPCSRNYTPQGGKAVLLVDEWYNRTVYDVESDPTLAGTGIEVFPFLAQLYEESLRDLNIKYDRYDDLFAQVSRGGNLGFYSEPTDQNDWGGIRTSAGAHRYQEVIWPTGQHNEHTVLDSSQLELAAYLISVNEGDLWLAGRNVCEDKVLSGIADGFDGGTFWQDYVGAVSSDVGCPESAGLADRVFRIQGLNDADFTAFQVVAGWANCPLFDQPDKDMEVNGASQGTSTIIFQFENLAATLNETSGLQCVQPGAAGNKMITTMFDHGLLTSRAARACITRAILVDFGVTMPGTVVPWGTLCANSTTDVLPTSPRRFALDQNYPNPFNPQTTIKYSLPKDNMKVALTIFDVSGREVVKLVDRVEGENKDYAVYWNGKNSSGHEVSSGVYFYRLNADDLSATKKMVLLK